MWCRGFCYFIFITAIAMPAFAEPHTERVEAISRSLSPANVAALYEFTNYRSDGTVVTYNIKFQIKDINRSHALFLKPEREKGREVLRTDDAIWTFMPSVGRAVRIADRESFAGGDFSNADVLRVDWTEKYSVSLAKETTNQWIYDLSAKNADAAYAKMRIWVDKKQEQPVQQYFYDSKGTLLKICKYGAVTKYGKITRPARLVMENVITKQKSEMKVLEFEGEQKFPDSKFTVDGLGK